MRTFPSRFELPKATNEKLAALTKDIVALQDSAGRKAMAAEIYGRSRRAAWFRPVLSALSIMAGDGQRCMCCSGSEASQVEHFRDKAGYPELAMTWENFLWICGICNLAKGNRFNSLLPPLNPLVDNIWEFFFLDEYGNLCSRWDTSSNSLNVRAEETIACYGLDRQALQETRLARLQELRRAIRDSLQLMDDSRLLAEDLECRILEWHSSPLQPDVADFFFNGPGATTEPFKQVLERAQL